MLGQYPGYENNPKKIPVGIDMESLEVRFLELEKEPGLIIGEAGMGRTTMLKNVLQHLHTQKAEKVYIFDSPKGDLALYDDRENISYAAHGSESLKLLEELSAELAARKEDFENENKKIQD